MRQALWEGVTAEAYEVRDAGDHVVVLVQAHRPQEWGEQPPSHGEVVTVRDEKVVYPTVNEALAAAAPDG